ASPLTSPMPAPTIAPSSGVPRKAARPSPAAAPATAPTAANTPARASRGRRRVAASSGQKPKTHAGIETSRTSRPPPTTLSSRARTGRRLPAPVSVMTPRMAVPTRMDAEEPATTRQTYVDPVRVGVAVPAVTKPASQIETLRALMHEARPAPRPGFALLPRLDSNQQPFD